jgi:hypothetical protein
LYATTGVQLSEPFWIQNDTTLEVKTHEPLVTLCVRSTSV